MAKKQTPMAWNWRWYIINL